MVVATTSTLEVRDNIIAWLAPLNVSFTCRSFNEDGRRADYQGTRHWATIDYSEFRWKIEIDFEEDEKKMMFLLKFGEYV